MGRLKVSPNPSALILSMRCIGYSFNNAIADIIDNSITANASEVAINCTWNDDKPSIEIRDNGKGMDYKELVEAMRVGSQSPVDERSKDDLGRFGLGLKTASFSQCKKLIVKTRKNDITFIAKWDLDHVVRVNEWEIDISEAEDDGDLKTSGTIIKWESIDTLDNKNEEDSEKYFNKVVKGLIDHISIVYHRFMDGDFNKIDFIINGSKCIPYDPFFKEKSDQLPTEIINNCVVCAYSLPHHSKISRKEWEIYAGDEGYFLNQGFYLYRNGRLILKGSWFGLIKRTDNTKLCRISLDIGNNSDLQWQIDVKKSRANPPAHIRKRLRELINTLIKPSKNKVNHRATKLTNKDRDPFWKRNSNDGRIQYKINREHPCIKNYIDSLEEKYLLGLENTFKLIDATIPIEAIYSDHSNDHNLIDLDTLSFEDLTINAKQIYHFYESKGEKRDNILNIIRSTEPFRSSWTELKETL